MGKHTLSSSDVLEAAIRSRGRGVALDAFNGCSVGVARFAKHPLWEMHPAADEFLQVFEGELDLTVLAAGRTVETTLKPGAIFVVPKGVWHSPRPRGTVTLLFVSDTRGTKISNRKDPRTDKSTG